MFPAGSVESFVSFPELETENDTKFEGPGLTVPARKPPMSKGEICPWFATTIRFLLTPMLIGAIPPEFVTLRRLRAPVPLVDPEDSDRVRALVDGVQQILVEAQLELLVAAEGPGVLTPAEEGRACAARHVLADVRGVELSAGPVLEREHAVLPGRAGCSRSCRPSPPARGRGPPALRTHTSKPMSRRCLSTVCPSPLDDFCQSRRPAART